jgi:hypothetical protein
MTSHSRISIILGSVIGWGRKIQINSRLHGTVVWRTLPQISSLIFIFSFSSGGEIRLKSNDGKAPCWFFVKGTGPAVLVARYRTIIMISSTSSRHGGDVEEMGEDRGKKIGQGLRLALRSEEASVRSDSLSIT